MSEIEILTFDEAVALLPDGDEIHTFTNPVASLLIGTDWRRREVIELLLRPDSYPQRSGPMAQSMGHGLACQRGAAGPVFIQTRKEDDQ